MFLPSGGPAPAEAGLTGQAPQPDALGAPRPFPDRGGRAGAPQVSSGPGGQRLSGGRRAPAAGGPWVPGLGALEAAAGTGDPLPARGSGGAGVCAQAHACTRECCCKRRPDSGGPAPPHTTPGAQDHTEQVCVHGATSPHLQIQK